jgi:hypothetical protein
LSGILVGDQRFLKKQNTFSIQEIIDEESQNIEKKVFRFKKEKSKN